MKEDLMKPKSIRMPGDGVFDRAMKATVSPELLEDNPMDIEGYLWKHLGKAAAAKMEEEIFKTFTGTIASADTPTANNTVFTKEALQAAVEKLADPFIGQPNTPENQHRMIERFGIGILNSKGIAVAKNIGMASSWPTKDPDPRLIGVMIMRQFTELGNPQPEDMLKDIADAAAGEIFDLDWLADKYPDDHLNLFIGKNKNFVVEEAGMGKYRYIPGRVEHAVFATGTVVDKPAFEMGTRDPRSYSRGKRMIAGNAVMQQMMASQPDLSEQIPDDEAIGRVDSIDFDPTTGNMNVTVTLNQPIKRITTEISLKGENDE